MIAYQKRRYTIVAIKLKKKNGAALYIALVVINHYLTGSVIIFIFIFVNVFNELLPILFFLLFKLLFLYFYKIFQMVNHVQF